MVTNSKSFILAASLLFLSSCEDGGVSGIGAGDCNPCVIFVTAAQSTGNHGGVAGADAKCNSDANKPSKGTFKAMIGATTRRGTAGSQLDWVIKPSTPYSRKDGTLIAYSTASGLLPADLTAAIDATTNYNIHTGLNADGSVATGKTCSDWTATTLGSNVAVGISNYTESGWIFYSDTTPCSGGTRRLYCVEQ